MSQQSRTRGISRRAFAVGSVLSGVMLAGTQKLLAQDATPVAEGTPAVTGPTPDVLITGLLDPRFIAVDGTDLYFTESGSGGDQPAAITMGEGTPEPAAPLSMTGNTGKLTRLSADGTLTALVSDFRSYTFGENGEIVGAAGLAVDGGTVYVAVGSPGPFVGQLALTGEEGVVYSVNAETGEKSVVADLVSYEIANNPDPMAIDSNLYGLAMMDGQIYVNDAGGNDILHVDPASGSIETFAVTGGLDAPFFPDPGNPARGGEKEIDSVPSTIVAGPDGQLYVSFITGGPFPPGLAPVYTYAADGTQSVYAEGLTMVQSLAFDSAGSLYACQMSTDFMTMAPGNVVKVSPDGNHEVVVDGLMLPAGIAFDADDNLYVVNKCTGIPGGGEILRYSGIGGGGGTGTPEATPVTSTGDEGAAQAASGHAEPKRILLEDTKFEPSTLTIPANVDVQIVLENRGYLMHDLVIVDPKIVSDRLAGGQITNLIVNLPAGEHQFYCSQVGHRQMGMTGTIIAE